MIDITVIILMQRWDLCKHKKVQGFRELVKNIPVDKRNKKMILV